MGARLPRAPSGGYHPGRAALVGGSACVLRRVGLRVVLPWHWWRRLPAARWRRCRRRWSRSQRAACPPTRPRPRMGSPSRPTARWLPSSRARPTWWPATRTAFATCSSETSPPAPPPASRSATAGRQTARRQTRASAPTGASSSSPRSPATWWPATRTAPPTCSSATSPTDRRPASASRPAASRPTAPAAGQHPESAPMEERSASRRPHPTSCRATPTTAVTCSSGRVPAARWSA